MSRRALTWLMIFLAAAALSAAAYFLPLLDWIAIAQIKIETYGAWAPALYVLLYVVFTLCVIPGSALTFTAGLLYGPWRGTAISLSASTIAAVIAFLVSRYVAREKIARRFGGSTSFQALDRAVANDAWKIVLLMRLSPAFPYVLLNYAFGLTRIPLITFTLFSLIGMAPATLLLTSTAAALGKSAESAKREIAEAGTRPPAALTEPRPLRDGEYTPCVTWLRNRQLVLWRETDPDEKLEQTRLADLIDSLYDRVRDGRANPTPVDGETMEEAQARGERALRTARTNARDAIRFLVEGRAGTARDRQKDAAAYLLEARGDKTVINWALWGALAASFLVTIVVGRMAKRALDDAARFAGPAATAAAHAIEAGATPPGRSPPGNPESPSSGSYSD